MRTLIIRNNTSEEKIWLKTFTENEEYTVPSDNSLAIKYSTLDSLLIAISNGEASIGNGIEFFTTVNEQINWLKNEDSTPRDSDGSPLQRIKVTTTGWHYQLHGVQFTSSKLNSIVSKKEDKTDWNFSTIKFYKLVNDVETEITGADLNQNYLDTNCIKTIIDWEPTFDIDIVGGTLKQISPPGQPVDVWVIAAPDIPTAYGGSKLFISGVDLQFIDRSIKVDGKTPKFMAYDSIYHSGKFRIILRHPVGFQHSLLMMFEIFKE